jgi:hypothetical protein
MRSAIGFVRAMLFNRKESPMIARYIAVLGLLGCAFLPDMANAQRHSETITCESRDYRPAHCRVNWRQAQLVRQISSTACIEGRTWGMDRGGIWVNQGCAGVFAQVRGAHRPGMAGGWHPGPGWDRSIRLKCESEDYRYRMCRVDTGRGSAVRIEQRISDTRCIEGRNWGWNRAGIWVDQGCAAVFVVDRRWR